MNLSLDRAEINLIYNVGFSLTLKWFILSLSFLFCPPEMLGWPSYFYKKATQSQLGCTIITMGL